LAIDNFEEEIVLDKFIGSWELVVAEFSKQDGSSLRPLGDSPSGLLVYGEEGWMSAQLHSSERKKFLKNDQLAGTDAEMKAAYSSYAAYYGTYDVDMERKVVRHQVLGSLFPNQADSTLDRFFQFSDNDRILTLRTSPFRVDGEELTGTLVWEKIG